MMAVFEPVCLAKPKNQRKQGKLYQTTSVSGLTVAVDDAVIPVN